MILFKNLPTMDVPKSPKECFDFFVKEQKEAIELKQELLRDSMGRAITINSERRKFYQNIAVSSATLLGLASVFSSLSRNITLSYIISGLALHLAVIATVFIYLRTILDHELEEINSLPDKYGDLVEKQISLPGEFLTPALGTRNEQEAKGLITAYYEKLKVLGSTSVLQDSIQESIRQKELRQSGRGEMEFYGEVITFLFVLGSFFILFGISGRCPVVLEVILMIALTFIVTFTNLLQKLLKWPFRGLAFLRRHKWI